MHNFLFPVGVSASIALLSFLLFSYMYRIKRGRLQCNSAVHQCTLRCTSRGNNWYAAWQCACRDVWVVQALYLELLRGRKRWKVTWACICVWPTDQPGKSNGGKNSFLIQHCQPQIVCGDSGPFEVVPVWWIQATLWGSCLSLLGHCWLYGQAFVSDSSVGAITNIEIASARMMT